MTDDAVTASPASVPIAPAGSPSERTFIRIADVAVICGLGALGAVSLWFGRNVPFNFDEWEVLLLHHDGNYLTPLNGHLIIVPILVYQALLNTVGTSHHFPYMVVGVAISLAVPASFYLTHRRLTAPFAAATLTLLLAWSPISIPGLFFPFLMNFGIPLVCLIWAWHLTRADDVRRDLAAALLVAIALASSGVGVTVAFTVIADVALGHSRRLSRLALFAVPVAAWALWFAFRHDPVGASSMSSKLSYSWTLATDAFTSVAHGSVAGALALSAGMVAVFLAAALRWGTFDRRVGVLVVSAGVFVASCAWGRAGSRYLASPAALWYEAVIFVFLAMALARCLRGVEVGLRIGSIGLALVLAAAIGLIAPMRTMAHVDAAFGDIQRPRLAALEAMGPQANPTRVLSEGLSGKKRPLTAAAYLEVVDRYGPIVGNVRFADIGDEAGRVQADAWMIADEHIAVRPISPSGAACPSAVRPHPGAPGAPGGGTAHDVTVVTVRGGRRAVITAGRSAATIRVRRFAREFTGPPLSRVAPGASVSVVIPRDRSAIPWRIEVRGTGSRVALCESG